MIAMTSRELSYPISSRLPNLIASYVNSTDGVSPSVKPTAVWDAQLTNMRYVLHTQHTVETSWLNCLVTFAIQHGHSIDISMEIL